MRSFTNKIYLGTPANMNLMSRSDSLLKVTMKGLEDFFFVCFLPSHHFLMPAKHQSDAGDKNGALQPFLGPIYDTAEAVNT